MKHRTANLVALFVATAIASSALAGSARHDRDAQRHLDLGASSAYACVGKLEATTSTGDVVFSGVLIAPDWVLTVSHCLEDVRSVRFTIEKRTYFGVRWVRHPGWDGDFAEGYDIALIQLDGNVAGVQPARRYAGSNELHSVGTIVGFGRAGTGLTGATVLDGRRRAGQNVIDRYYKTIGRVPRLLMCDFDNPDSRRDSAYGSDVALDLEYLSGPGDSGGGLFIQSGGATYLAAINSFGMARRGEFESRYGQMSGHVRVAAFAEWIDGTMQSHAATAQTPPPERPHAVIATARESDWSFGGSAHPGPYPQP